MSKQHKSLYSRFDGPNAVFHKRTVDLLNDLRIAVEEVEVYLPTRPTFYTNINTLIKMIKTNDRDTRRFRQNMEVVIEGVDRVAGLMSGAAKEILSGFHKILVDAARVLEGDPVLLFETEQTNFTQYNKAQLSAFFELDRILKSNGILKHFSKLTQEILVKLQRDETFVVTKSDFDVKTIHANAKAVMPDYSNRALAYQLDLAFANVGKVLPSPNFLVETREGDFKSDLEKEGIENAENISKELKDKDYIIGDNKVINTRRWKEDGKDVASLLVRDKDDKNAEPFDVMVESINAKSVIDRDVYFSKIISSVLYESFDLLNLKIKQISGNSFVFVPKYEPITKEFWDHAKRVKRTKVKYSNDVEFEVTYVKDGHFMVEMIVLEVISTKFDVYFE